MSDRVLQRPQLVTPDEYLEQELEAQFKHEFVDGVLYGMAGASDRHGIVTSNFVVLIGSRLQNPCLIFSADMKLRIREERSTLFYYLDVLVTCANDDRADAYFREKPVLLVEVLSPSTERIDRTEKLSAYSKLPSLIEYVIADQDIPKVEVFRRSNAWTREVFYPEDSLRLDSVGLDLSMGEIYRRVPFT